MEMPSLNCTFFKLRVRSGELPSLDWHARMFRPGAIELPVPGAERA